ncbi:MAG: aspartate-semialdehyde dehydrogenase [Candidatus Stygibacter australis]|nr:aspartate-semialdehyde dehydrogenase [Candidatus Stygibacter australis]MDP8323342.1 aspartate-semialdehyde dehydrogenase [Candidatus Stygibacter australis]
MPENRINLAILGATGAVGREMLKIVHQLKIPYNTLRLLASSSSSGSYLEYEGKRFQVEEVSSKSFKDIDICLASAGSAISKIWAPIARENGVVFIDNSSAFRLDDDVPLVVPEVNALSLHNHQLIIGNPNCSTIQLVQVLHPLHVAFNLKRVIVSTYQAVSGAGKKGILELENQLKAQVEGIPLEILHFPYQIAGNVIPQIDVFNDNGYTGEEMKIIQETRKILSNPGLALTATAVRVPVVYGHSESVQIQFQKSVTPDQVREILNNTPNLQIMDNPGINLYPTALDSEDNDNTLVGRIRQDLLGDDWISLWIVSNNLRKGAALNAVQIADYMIKNKLL